MITPPIQILAMNKSSERDALIAGIGDRVRSKQHSKEVIF
jgi:hypothetical protein